MQKTRLPLSRRESVEKTTNTVVRRETTPLPSLEDHANCDYRENLGRSVQKHYSRWR